MEDALGVRIDGTRLRQAYGAADPIGLVGPIFLRLWERS
jgi:hypothetical protein